MRKSIICLSIVVACLVIFGRYEKTDDILVYNEENISLNEENVDFDSFISNLNDENNNDIINESINNIENLDIIDNNQKDTVAEENHDSSDRVDVTENKQKYVNISISCKTIFENLDEFPQSKIDILPPNGQILSENVVEFTDGDSVFDVLKTITRDKKIHMEFVNTPFYGSSYIEGINNIYEFDCGELSGWMYSVNGVFPTTGISSYILSENDVIKILYTCDLGNDLR